MVDRLPSGPYRVVEGPAGQIPWYMVPFDKAGRCTGPRTAAELVTRASSGDFSDLVVFCHGWNNDWVQATRRYDQFIRGYLGLLAEHPPPGGVRKALLLGLFWPSKLLVEGDRNAPDIDADDAPDASDAAVAVERDEVAQLGESLSGAGADRFYELVQQESVSTGEAVELAEFFLPLLADDDEETGLPRPTAADLAECWAGAGSGEAFGLPDPREIVRTASVWLMKDRAGVVGRNGLAPLLSGIGGGIRIHLVGHSFGAKVVLSGLCAATLPLNARSMLLLQPAVSHLCFARSVPGTGRPGGYAGAPDRLALPVLSTFSKHDEPLTRWYQHALRRRSDLGDAEAAPDPPNRYAALGGFGPRPLDDRVRLLDVLDPRTTYPLDRASVYGVNATRTINDHGSISNPSTWWMLSQLIHAA